jgi:hypothetical protein
MVSTSERSWCAVAVESAANSGGVSAAGSRTLVRRNTTQGRLSTVVHSAGVTRAASGFGSRSSCGDGHTSIEAQCRCRGGGQASGSCWYRDLISAARR